jgi:hypothetical protein
MKIRAPPPLGITSKLNGEVTPNGYPDDRHCRGWCSYGPYCGRDQAAC